MLGYSNVSRETTIYLHSSVHCAHAEVFPSHFAADDQRRIVGSLIIAHRSLNLTL